MYWTPVERNQSLLYKSERDALVPLPPPTSLSLQIPENWGVGGAEDGDLAGGGGGVGGAGEDGDLTGGGGGGGGGGVGERLVE